MLLVTFGSRRRLRRLTHFDVHHGAVEFDRAGLQATQASMPTISSYQDVKYWGHRDVTLDFEVSW